MSTTAHLRAVAYTGFTGTHMKTSDHAIGRYIEHLRLSGARPATLYTLGRSLTRTAAALPPGGLLRASEASLMDWRRRLRVADATVISYVSHLMGFYEWACGQGLRGGNPAAKLPVPPRRRRLPRPIGDADLFRAVTYAPARILPWLVLAAWCGLRACEIARLRREDVLDTAAVPVLLLTATKGGRQRAVPLAPYALEVLRAAGMPAKGYLFRRCDGRHGPNTPQLVSKLCNDYLHSCGIAETLHQLRHWFGTQAYRCSHDLRAVQELLGHASPSTTAGYAAFDSPAQTAAVRALPVPLRLRAVRSQTS